VNTGPAGGIPAEFGADTAVGWRRVVRRGEDLFLVLPMLALMVLPCLAVVLRRFHTGIEGSMAFVQNCTLIVGMVGGAIAGGLCALIGIALSVLLGDTPGFVLALGTAISTVTGVAGGFWGQVAAHMKVK